MRLQPFLITSILAVGLAMPAMAQQSDSIRRSATNAAFETYGWGTWKPDRRMPSVLRCPE
jgi:hypothetical protein